MAYTTTWNAAFEATPAAGANVSGGDDRIRELKEAVRERMEKDHYWDETGTDADHGEHVKVTLRVGSAPTQAANKGIIYAKDVSGKAELFYIDEDGDEVQITSGGSLNVASTQINNIQTGTITIAAGDATNTDTITAVDTDKAFIVHNGAYTADNNTNRCAIALALTNATTVTATRGTGFAEAATVAYTVVEFI